MDCSDPVALGEFWAAMLGGEIAFSNEHVDVLVDGERLGRPITPWSRR